jgi:ATP-dependent protease HslVU (ClpYQ) peptidase subunit
MTVIVAAKAKGGGVILAADSQTTQGWLKEQNDRSKLWTADPYVFGAAGCVRTAQVVRHHTGWPKYRPDEDTDIEAFLVKSVVPAIRTAVKDTGVVRTTDGAEHIDTQIIMAWRDHFAIVSGNGAVTTDITGRCAIGSGYAEALGHLGEKGPWTVAQVCEAARRATLSAHGCAGPIDYVTTTDLTITRGTA